jgi:hypothetical protein
VTLEHAPYNHALGGRVRRKNLTYRVTSASRVKRARGEFRSADRCSLAWESYLALLPFEAVPRRPIFLLVILPHLLILPLGTVDDLRTMKPMPFQIAPRSRKFAPHQQREELLMRHCTGGGEYSLHGGRPVQEKVDWVIIVGGFYA